MVIELNGGTECEGTAAKGLTSDGLSENKEGPTFGAIYRHTSGEKEPGAVEGGWKITER